MMRQSRPAQFAPLRSRSGNKTILCALTVSVGAAAIADVSAAPTESDERRRLEEVVVTATKRETNLQETAAAVSVMSEESIEKRHLVGMEDYLAALPGVSYQDRGAGSNTVTIRGIAMGSQLDTNSPVGNYFGEVPVTGLGPQVNGNQAGNADIKMVDVQRVEVLRGPQGTLYGSGTMGGTVRVIPKAPNLQRIEGSIGTEYSVTARNGGQNYMVQGVLNAPLIEDTLAVRMAAYRFDNEGYIENVAVTHPDQQVVDAVNAGAFAKDRKHVGGDAYTGFRVSALWRPTANFSASMMVMNQRIEQDGFREVELNLPGRYQQTRVRVGEMGLDDEFVNIDLDIANLVLEYDLGWGSVLNSTSLINSKAASEVELSFLGAPFVGGGSYNENEKEVIVNELRFTSDFSGPLQVLGGMYYEDRTVDIDVAIRWTGRPPAPADAFYSQSQIRNTQKQTAFFGELAYTPIDPLTLTLGARYFKFEQGIPVSRSLGVPSTNEGRKASVDGENLKFNISYKFNDQWFAFAQWSQGFREPRFQGIILPEYDSNGNGLVEFRDGIERKVVEGLLDPDSVDNYEAGVKFSSAGGRLQASLSGFLIDWEGIPVVPSLTAFQGAALYFNAGKARSQGLEFEASAELIDDLFLELSASWVDATLAESAEGLGNKGDRLPGSAEYNVKAALEKRFTVAGYDSFVRGDYTYVSEYYSLFQAVGIPGGGYSLVDLSAGVAINNIKVGLFVKNAANADDFTWVDNVFDAQRAYRLRPRTIGFNVAVAF
jgi:iron complex outermembrane receptor protein